jgi:hypothetical protein
MLAFGGCSDPATPQPTPAPTVTDEPMTTQAAQATAQEWFTRESAGDWAGAWELYTDEGRAAISQADYVRLNTTCPRGQSVPWKIIALSSRAPDKVIVLALANAAGASFVMDYEHGQWLIEPTRTNAAEFGEGVDKAIANRRANGLCLGLHSTTSTPWQR